MAIVTLANRSNRQAGSFTHSWYAVPANASGPCKFTFEISSSHLQDGTKSMSYLIQIADDNAGLNTSPLCAGSWVGDAAHRDKDGTIGVGPTTTFHDIAFAAGKYVRLTVTHSTTLNIGLTLEIA